MKIVFSIPGFDAKSNGLRVFHCVAREFQKLGAHVSIIPWDNTGGFVYEIPKEYEDLYSTRFELNDAIAFLPDAIPTDIAKKIKSQTKLCVWWLCNVPGLLGHEMCPVGTNDILLSYSKLISTELPQFYYHSDIANLPPIEEIKAKRKDADLILVYTGKGMVRPIPKTISDYIAQDKSKVIHVSRFFPETKESLYSLLMRAKFVISFDPISNLNYEANLFGAPVFMVNQMRSEFSFQKDFNIPLHGFFTYPEEFISISKVGLDLDLIHKTHKKAIETNKERVEKVFKLLQQKSETYSSIDLELQPNTSEMYRKLTLFELPNIKKTICPSVGSSRQLSRQQIDYINYCVRSGVEDNFVKKKSFFQKIKRSFRKRTNRFFKGEMYQV